MVDDEMVNEMVDDEMVNEMVDDINLKSNQSQ